MLPRAAAEELGREYLTQFQHFAPRAWTPSAMLQHGAQRLRTLPESDRAQIVAATRKDGLKGGKAAIKGLLSKKGR